MKLVIVESPAKARTINKYLGSNYHVIASFGHVRDLPTKPGSVLPEKDFEIIYQVSDKAKKYVSEIVKHSKGAEEIILATDPDREGESISWHIIEVLKEKKILKNQKISRVAFNEITKTAVKAAMAAPRDIDKNLVDAGQARRALDYLVGFTLSPLLWRKMPGCRSAGRVQSVALRLLCDRQEEIDKFRTQEYWDIILTLRGEAKTDFDARITHINDDKLEKFSIQNQEQADKFTADLQNAKFSVVDIEKKQQKRFPAAPFITSSLQQEASRKLGFSAKKTMQIAQRLYEGIDIKGESIGLITYMRTDGVNLSSEAVNDIREVISEKYGNNYLPSTSRAYKSKAKNAQEAHEAIRPTNIRLYPEQISSNLDQDQLKLYTLIWRRTLACQTENALIDMVAANLATFDKKFQARATGNSIAFDGFYKIYKEGQDDKEDEQDNILPPLKEKEQLELKKVSPNQHFTEPPPKYTEASLVKKLEEYGIGRPSTYASIISVLQDRGYANLEKKRFTPSDLGRLLTVFLVKYFEKYLQYDFTAGLEDELDQVASGDLNWKKLLGNFWSGFDENITKVYEYPTSEVIGYVQDSLEHHLFGDPESEEYEKNKLCAKCKDGKLSLKLGKYGAFLGCSNYPECDYKKSVSNLGSGDEVQNNTEIVEKKSLGYNDAGEEIFIKKGPFGFYIQEGEAKAKGEKPNRSSIPPSMNINDIDLDFAKKLLKLPIMLGKHSESGEEVSVGIGKYGPFIKHARKFTSIPEEIDAYNIDLTTAERLIEEREKQKKTFKPVAKKGKK